MSSPEHLPDHAPFPLQSEGLGKARRALLLQELAGGEAVGNTIGLRNEPSPE